MKNIETIEDLYQRKFDQVPDDINKGIGHFNIFKLEPYIGKTAKPVPYIRRDYFKITLAEGESKIQYADKVLKIENRALVFSNPYIPYQWDCSSVKRGVFCIFNHEFFSNYGNLNQYNVFQPQGAHVFELTDEQTKEIRKQFDKMTNEINSDYQYKYDIIRTVIFELIHFAMKMTPPAKPENRPGNANKRITSLFSDLLERQFPIDENHLKVHLKSASDFAEKLNVHVNHLNRAVKDITLKTTTRHITDRILQEAKILLKNSTWNISQIAYSLGFNEVTHFNNFFKKNTQSSPVQFRKNV